MRRITAASVLSIMLMAALFLFIGWGETGGIVHAFRKHSFLDGCVAIVVPPWAWYRGYEFFRHKDNRLGQIDAPPKYPLNAREDEVITRIFVKALAEPLSEADLGEYKKTASEYAARTGRGIPEDDLNFFLEVMRLTTDYNHELGRCLLVSTDQKSPFISPELDSLRERVKTLGSIRPEKLEADYRKIESVAYGRPWTDEFGQQFEPLTKEDILETLKHLDIQDENFRNMAEVMREVAQPKSAAKP